MKHKEGNKSRSKKGIKNKKGRNLQTDLEGSVSGLVENVLVRTIPEQRLGALKLVLGGTHVQGGVAWLVNCVHVAAIFNKQVDEFRDSLGAGLVQFCSVPTVNNINGRVCLQEGLGTLCFAWFISSLSQYEKKEEEKKKKKKKSSQPWIAASYSAVRLFLSRNVALEPYLSSNCRVCQCNT